MSKLFKKSALALVLALAMLLMMVPAMAMDEPPAESTTPGSPIIPETTDDIGSLTIVKYEGDPLTLDGSKQKNTGENADGLGGLEDALEADNYAPVAYVTYEVFFIEPWDYDGTNGYETHEFDKYFDKDSADYIEAKIYVPKDDATYEMTTDENGEVYQGNMPLGIYFIREAANSAVKTSTPNFFISVPFTNPVSLTEWVYDVVVYPKNELELPEIHKYVDQEFQDHYSAAAEEEIKWLIFSEIPYTIANANKYEITDVIDPRLQYVEKSITIGYESDNNWDLSADTDYTIVFVKDTNTLTITFNETGRVKLRAEILAKTSATDHTLPRIAITFKTKILFPNNGSSMGQEIPNSATLDYTNSRNQDFQIDTEIPVVHTGGYLFEKVDGDSNVLAGAEFMVFASAADAAEANPNNAIWAYDNYNPATANYTNTFVSDSTTSETTGEVRIFGLPYGTLVENEDGTFSWTDEPTTYWLVEVKAPADYNLLKQPKEFMVDAGTHLKDGESYKAKVTNRQGFELPITGGVGTVIFTVGGILLIALAAFLLLKKKGSAKA